MLELCFWKSGRLFNGFHFLWPASNQIVFSPEPLAVLAVFCTAPHLYCGHKTVGDDPIVDDFRSTLKLSERISDVGPDKEWVHVGREHGANVAGLVWADFNHLVIVLVQ